MPVENCLAGEISFESNIRNIFTSLRNGVFGLQFGGNNMMVVDSDRQTDMIIPITAELTCDKKFDRLTDCI